MSHFEISCFCPVATLLPEDKNMLLDPHYEAARNMLLTTVAAVETERIRLSECGGRILAQDLVAAESIPSFDRSPYDGYALRAADTLGASGKAPVTLRVLEEIPAGGVPAAAVTKGTAAKVLTGAPIPKGADAVIKYECTAFTKETVTVFSPLKCGENIIYAGEDVRKGDVLASRGEIIDPGTMGALAAQGVVTPLVYRVPKVGILSTGSELVDAGEVPAMGKIRNSNRYMLEAALTGMGCEPVWLGTAEDAVEKICVLLQRGLSECDAVISTGGVSAGDYDLTPDAMKKAGVDLLFRGVDMKPGMACAYGICNGKLVCGLSGNPASSVTSFYVVAAPALKKLMGYRDPVPQEIQVRLSHSFDKNSVKTRFLRGKLELKNGVACMAVPKNQGNVVLSSMIGCDMMAVIPEGSGPVRAGTVLRGFLL